MSATYNNGTVTFTSDLQFFDSVTVMHGVTINRPVTTVIGFGEDYLDLQAYPPHATPITGATGYRAYSGLVLNGVTFLDPAALTVLVAGDGEGGTVFQGTDYVIQCLAAGTRIATPCGERAIESLRAGDAVLCHAAGARPVARPVRRILRHAAADARAAPVRIVADAFADGMPRRDLRLSPDHAVAADGLLVPAKYLQNGLSIVRETACGPVDYYHLETDAHDLVAAEGLTVETHLPVSTTPTARDWDARGCAPLTVTGAALDALHDRLFRRAAMLHLFARLSLPAPAPTCVPA